MERDSPKSAIFNTLRVPPRVSSVLNKIFLWLQVTMDHTGRVVEELHSIAEFSAHHFVVKPIE